MTASPLDHQIAGFRKAAELASVSLSKWLGRPVSISIEQVQAMPLEAAVGILGDGEGLICGCAMNISGGLQGLLVLLCDDEAGLGLAEMLVGRQPGTAAGWGELEQSAVVETANIIGCAYLNAVADSTVAAAAMPSPPWFVRDYAAAVMESIVMSRPLVEETVFLTRTEFSIESSPVRCSLVFVPDPSKPSGGSGDRP